MDVPARTRTAAFRVLLGFQERQTYESVSAVLRPDEIDVFLRAALRELRTRSAPNGHPFSIYMGCDQDDAQLLEVCLPTSHGTKILGGSNVAYTVVRGRECDYPQILVAYDAVARHVAANGLAATGPPREVYLTDLDADAEQEMQIVFPIGGDPRAAGGRRSKP